MTGRRRRIFDNRMPIAKVDAADDVLTCPKCGAKTMVIYVEEGGVQKVKCANCKDLVAYTENLIRVL